MRKLLCILCGLMLAASAADAQMLLYRGVIKTRHSGDGTDSRQTYKTWLIIDRATGTIGRINYYPAGSFFSIEPDQVVTTNLVRLPLGKTATVLASAATAGEPGAQAIASTFARGNNAKVQVARETYAMIPRVLEWNARSVGPAGDPPATDIQEEIGVLTLDEASTITSNNKADTFAGAKTRVAQRLEALGYREIVFK